MGIEQCGRKRPLCGRSAQAFSQNQLNSRTLNPRTFYRPSGIGLPKTNSTLWHWRQDLPGPSNPSRIEHSRSSPARSRRNKLKSKTWNERRTLSLQLRELLSSAFEDRERSEKVSLLDSALLDVERGEVLSSPRYSRAFRL